MISTQEVVDRCLSALDAEGSDRYLFEPDFKPAINYAVGWLVSVFNKGFGQDKLTEENLRDLTKVVIYRANIHSRIEVSTDTTNPDNVWSILAVFPEPVTGNIYPPIPPPAPINASLSQYRPDLLFIEGSEAAGRLTMEEWNEGTNNIFVAGNSIMSQSGLKKYAYLSETTYDSGRSELTIKPDVAEQLVAVSYLKYPTPVSTISDSIEFPETITDLLVEKSLNFIAYKQGDGTNLHGVTENDIARLSQLMT